MDSVICDELDIDEEQRNRERAFLEFEINEIESAQLVSGEDEELEKRYRKLNNGRKILETLQGVRDLTGYESGQGAGESDAMRCHPDWTYRNL